MKCNAIQLYYITDIQYIVHILYRSLRIIFMQNFCIPRNLLSARRITNQSSEGHFNERKLVV